MVNGPRFKGYATWGSWSLFRVTPGMKLAFISSYKINKLHFLQIQGMDRKGKNVASGSNLDPPECSRQSHPTTLAALMGYLSFVYDTDAYKDHQIPPHPALKRILFGPEGFQWTRNCEKELEKLERASGIPY
jgi:hypothetical protein